MPAALKPIRLAILIAVLKRRALLWLAFATPWIVAQRWFLLPLLVGGFAIDIWYWCRQIERHFPAWMNACCAELEDSSELLWHAESSIAQLQQQRLHRRLDSVMTTARVSQIANAVSRVGKSFRIALMMNLLVATAVWIFVPGKMTPSSLVVPSTPRLGKAKSELRIKLIPPAYTGIAGFESEVKDLSIPEHSLVIWCSDAAQGAAGDQEIRLSDGQVLVMKNVDKQYASNLICVTWQATESVFWSWSGDAKSQRWNIKIKLDQAPEIEIRQPSETLQILGPEAKQVRMQIRVSDDYQLVNAQVHLTLARGSGENIRFSDKEVALPRGTDPKLRVWDKSWTLAELGMEPGDELYFFVRALDNAMPTPHLTTSATYTVRLPAPEAKEEQISVLPILVKPESLRSQRQIIIDTEQLIADIKANPKLSPAQVRVRSETIANDEAALRRRYGKFLGEESSLFGDDDEGHGDHKEQGGEYKPVDMTAAYGHAHDQAENATLFDESTKKILRKVLAAMWDAEKALRALNPNAALAPENKALEGIKQLQQADRIYLHKAAFVPPVIKEEKRLSGDVLDPKNWKTQTSVTITRVPAEIATLIDDLSKDAPLPSLWSKTARTWFSQQFKDEEQRLAAQASVQDVLDGCDACRGPLRAWLRQSLGEPSLMLQAREEAANETGSSTTAQPKPKSRLAKAWKESGLATSGERQ